MTGSDSEASGPPDRGATPRECRGVLSRHEIGGATAVPSQNRPTNGGDCRAMCEPRLNRLRQPAMTGWGQNRTQTRALIYVRSWGKNGSRWARASDVVPIVVAHGPVRHVGRAHGPNEKGGCQFCRARYAVREVRPPPDTHHRRPDRGQETGDAAGRPRRVQEGRTRPRAKASNRAPSYFSEAGRAMPRGPASRESSG